VGRGDEDLRGDAAGLIPPGDDPDLDELVLASMATTVAQLAILSGPQYTHHVFHLDDGTEVAISGDRGDPGMDWRRRLAFIGRTAKTISQAYPDLEVDGVAHSLLVLDGWVLSGGHVKTPGWMFDHAELEFYEMVDFEGLEWLAYL